MTTAVQGLQLDLQTALRSLNDHNGNALEFKEQKDGSYVAKEVEGSKNKAGDVAYTYIYSLVPQTTLVTGS